MKNYRIPIVLTLAISVLSIVSCTKKANDPTGILEGVNNQNAIVQVYNGILNSNRNFIYANGLPVNGSSVAFGAAFPSSAYGFAVWVGNNSFTVKDTLSTTTQAASSFFIDTKAGGSYSVFMYDTITSPKRLVVENNFSNTSPNQANVRFVNLIYNPTTTPNVDVFSVNQNGVIFSNIPVAALTSYMSFPSGVSDTWQIRQTGTSTVMASLSITSSSLAPQRSYTVVYRGSYRVSANRGVALIANN
jgi:hypothetical protein